ncbi:MAG: Gfo/Idh/MocA family oxidoreductase [Pseudomonadota bacterium]
MQTQKSPIRTAVVGVGYLGRFHAQKFSQLSQSELVGVVDNDEAGRNAVAEELNVKGFANVEDIIDVVDAVSIATPTITHHSIARSFLERGIHTLVEKPITATLEEADELIELASQNGCLLQVGHMQRFHPALLDLGERLHEPRFIESHRLAPFNPRGTDVDVVLDLMIHDLDIVLNLVDAEVSRVSANGACVVSDSIDIANARIDFTNGCAANITASRVSNKTERKMRVFQRHRCLSADLYNHKLDDYARVDGSENDEWPKIERYTTEYEQHDALLSQIEAFLHSILNQKQPLVAGRDGRRALATAMQITDLIGAELNVESSQ